MKKTSLIPLILTSSLLLIACTPDKADFVDAILDLDNISYKKEQMVDSDFKELTVQRNSNLYYKKNNNEINRSLEQLFSCNVNNGAIRFGTYEVLNNDELLRDDYEFFDKNEEQIVTADKVNKMYKTKSGNLESYQGSLTSRNKDEYSNVYAELYQSADFIKDVTPASYTLGLKESSDPNLKVDYEKFEANYYSDKSGNCLFELIIKMDLGYTNEQTSYKAYGDVIMKVEYKNYLPSYTYSYLSKNEVYVINGVKNSYKTELTSEYKIALKSGANSINYKTYDLIKTSE